MYGGWPSSVRDFLRPVYPGMLRQVAKNVFTVVCEADLLFVDLVGMCVCV